jgi:protocatechuate 3,4-dioxygenase beta subunit
MNTKDIILPRRRFTTAIAVMSILWLAACSSLANAGLPAAATQLPTLALAPLATVTQAPATATSTAPSAVTAAPADTATSVPAASATPGQSATSVDAAPACTSPAALTPAETEGPYFKAGSPLRANLLDQGMAGTQLTLTGYVLTADCKPVANALLDFWQADASGAYDNNGYTLRGHQLTDANGRFQLVTVVPGLYPGRTEHIHVKVQKPNGAVLTSQLYFPGVANNDSDGIYDPRLLITLLSTGSTWQGTYTFIIQ